MNDSYKNSYIVDPIEYNDIKLLGAEIMKAKKEAAKKKTKQENINKNYANEELKPEFSIKELKRFARITIEERIKFCLEYKKDEPIERCVCSAIERWIRLFKSSSEGSKELGKARLAAVEKLFGEMKEEGIINYIKF